ncbi:MAG: PAS domain-containing sensor histidine kinase [Gammaproteobacteria bacterium]|nr:PAS domain-containing sensor histidine kinase [Gammaproteobacteria bacterium]
MNTEQHCNEDFLSNIVAKMPGHVYWKNRNGVIIGCNIAQAQSLGFKSQDDVIGKTDYDITTKEKADAIRKIDLQVMKTGKMQTTEETFTTKDNKELSYLSKKEPLRDCNGEVIGILGISFDITDRKSLEQKLHDSKIQSHLKDERIRAMKTIAASIAHELRTPLLAINNYADAQTFLDKLIAGYKAAHNADLDIPSISPSHLDVIKDSFKEIQKEAEYSNSVINLLLTNLRELEFAQKGTETCSINECIDDVIKRYHFTDQKDASLVKRTNNINFTFKGKSLLISHILFNLIRNALHFIAKADKGEISICTKRGKQFNELHFKDTGAGISAEDLPHIFDHFFSKRKNGTGIGLSFCNMVMQNLGGEIRCFSKEGEYTEFVLYFPKIQKSACIRI